MKTLIATLGVAGLLLLTGCGAAPAPAPTVTVTVTATPEASAPDPEPTRAGDSWQRFRDDPADAFVFASAYEMIWGAPIGNGEGAESTVSLADTMCGLVETGTYTWDTVGEPLDDVSAEELEKLILTAQVFCPEVD